MPRRAELDCVSVRDRLDPYLEDELGRRETRRLRAHLEGCPGCREELRLARELRAALRDGLPTLSCPPEVSERVLRIARAEAVEQGALEGSASPETIQGRLGGRSVDPSGRGLGRKPGRLRPVRWLAALAARPARRPAASDGGAPGRWLAALAVGRLKPAASIAVVVALVVLLVGVPWALWNMAGSPDPEMARSEQPAGDTRPASPDLEDYSADEVARAERQARMVLAAVASVGRDAGRTVQDRVLEDALNRPARQAVRGLRSIRPSSDPALDPATRPAAERRQP